MFLNHNHGVYFVLNKGSSVTKSCIKNPAVDSVAKWKYSSQQHGKREVGYTYKNTCTYLRWATLCHQQAGHVITGCHPGLPVCVFCRAPTSASSFTVFYTLGELPAYEETPPDIMI